MAIAPVKVIVSTRLKLGVSAHYANEHRQDIMCDGTNCQYDVHESVSASECGKEEFTTALKPVNLLLSAPFHLYFENFLTI